MPFIPHTPEALIKRSDSKNPATTCKGITADGRHCRRDIASQQSPLANRRASKAGVVAVLSPGDDNHDGAAAYFCWQHKDQAAALTSDNHDGRTANLVPLQQRSSIDTLAERLGILDTEPSEQGKKTRRKKQHARPARKETLPQRWQDMDGPLLAVPEKGGRPPKDSRPAQHQTKKPAGTGLFCCLKSTDHEELPPSRPHALSEKPSRASNPHRPSASSQRPPAGRRYSSDPHSHPPHTSINYPLTSPHSQSLSPLTTPSHRPPPRRDPSSQTQQFLSLIPPHLSPATTSALLAELAKPISTLDEPGYIYIFWLTDHPDGDRPDDEVASTLVTEHDPPSPRRKSVGGGDVLQRYASQHRSGNGAGPRSLLTPSTNPTASPPTTVLLKIGRAANVQRRMNQWTRQCGYNVSLIRYYPYRPASASASAVVNSGQVRYAHKVERLIHLELAEQRVKRACEACGKEHREWFEVEGSRRGVRGVDEVVRRWVGWAERQ
ncbi:MAG: hypothetical protein OHK93_002798 [Ramalina farinacea]|uniref:Bacteriophage T5 Orf172 DNA-binding domain-containing protein n=1 Tax=Ramalina farinacea TaxID=258253 RepID=A0AA43QTV6_9LECA|nr:hypothetical protein [Ramalina farinacea]